MLNRHGLYDQAINHYQESLIISHEIGDFCGEGATVNNVWSLYGNLELYDPAIYNHGRTLITGYYLLPSIPN